MKTRLAFLFFLFINLFCIVNLNAQAPKFTNQENVYDYWAKRGIIQIMYSYLLDYMVTVPDSLISEPEKKAVKDYYEFFLSKVEEEQWDAIDLEKIGTFLSTNYWPNTRRQIFDPLVNQYENSHPMDDYFFKTMKPNSDLKSTEIPGFNNLNGNWNTTKLQIVNSYNNDLSFLKEDATSTFFNFTNLVYFLVGALLGVLGCYFFIKNQVSRALSARPKKGFLPFTKKIVQEGERLVDLENILKNSKSILIQKENEIQTLKNQISTLSKTAKEPSGKVVLKESNSVDLAVAKKVAILFNLPEPDGSFIVLNSDNETKDKSAYFKVDFIEGVYHGTINYISSEMDKHCINLIDDYLIPVCDIENIEDRPNATKVQVLEAGKVTLKDDRWVIDPNHKIKIRLI